MAAHHGVMGPFNSSQEDWLSCIIYLENYFVANDITDNKEAKCQAILLGFCVMPTYTSSRVYLFSLSLRKFPLRMIILKSMLCDRLVCGIQDARIQ